MVTVGLAWLLVAGGGCAPTVDGPAERQRAADRVDGDRLAAQLAALPGVVRAEVALHRPARDPLAPTPAAPPTASLVIIVDDRADRAALTTHARTLARATAPAVEPAIVVEIGATRPTLARVGPFTVEARSQAALKATLALALALIAGLAGWLAIVQLRRPGQRRGNSAQ